MKDVVEVPRLSSLAKGVQPVNDRSRRSSLLSATCHVLWPCYHSGWTAFIWTVFQTLCCLLILWDCSKIKGILNHSSLEAPTCVGGYDYFYFQWESWPFESNSSSKLKNDEIGILAPMCLVTNSFPCLLLSSFLQWPIHFGVFSLFFLSLPRSLSFGFLPLRWQQGLI